MVMIDMRKDLDVPDSWLVHLEDFFFVFIVDDLNFGKLPKDKDASSSCSFVFRLWFWGRFG